jgi:hypothetical protein
LGQKQILEKIIDGIDKCIDNNFTKTLLKAVFLLAFNAFLRLGEILVRSPPKNFKIKVNCPVT